MGIGLIAWGTAYGLSWLRDRPLAEAEQALLRGELQEAQQQLRSFLTEHPDDSRGLALLARVHVASGNPRRAIELFRQSGAATAEDMHALARAFIMVGRWTDGLRFLERVVEQQPENADAYYEITSCRLRLGLYSAALESAEKFAQLPGSEARGSLYVGTIHSDGNNYQMASEAYGRVLEFEPQGANLQVRADEFFLQYGRVLMRSGRQAEAIKQLKKSAEILPCADVYVELGNCHQQLQQMEPAVAAWQQALEYDPITPRARGALANTALEKKDAASALKWLTPLQRSPQLTSTGAYLLQRAYTFAGDEKQALHWQGKAAELRKQERFHSTLEKLLVEDPHSFWAYVIRAHRFAEAGDWEEAKAIIESLVKDAPSEPFVVDLAKAIRDRSAPPPLSRIPLLQY